MNKHKWNRYLRWRFHLSHNSKIVYFRNPKEFSYMEIERVNPTHKIILWGIVRKTKNKIMFGKILIPSIGFTILNLGFIDIDFAFILGNMFLGSMLSYFIYAPILGYKKCILKIYQCMKQLFHVSPLPY